MVFVAVMAAGCSKTDSGPTPGPDPNPGPGPNPSPAFDINSIRDNYEDIAAPEKYLFWGSHNVHDPSIIKSGEYYYAYSTDVAWGHAIRVGLQIRRSKDLVEWKTVGWVFEGLPAKGAAFIRQNNSEPFGSLWAPYVLKVGNEYRLYYSLSSAKPRLSVIGLATASSPEGPWKEKDLVVVSRDDQTIQTNAIDPAVVVTPTGEHWFYYGSAWDGIYALSLDPVTGLAKSPGYKGKRIANRGFTGGKYNGNIEGPEVVYNTQLKKYYLFISYDWLETKYNVRVAKGDNPDGPFYDYNGKDVNINEDHGPMILAPYQFRNHSGYQGVAHNAVFEDGTGQYFIAHQARPGNGKFFMNLHVRKIFWTPDGWPVVSPERYAWEDNSLVPAADISGNYEQIVMGYRVVPGYAEEQVSPDFQVSVDLMINADGSLNNNAGTWNYNAPWLELKWNNGYTDRVMVQRGRDWENKKNTIIFTGLNNEGVAVWGKKK
ncbi:arabinan endo-1,5-alpha-L-arabinosidase [Flavihumibacter sp. ZG627]|uniref:arabinan endo-1,5-alpha-L-arabinosidase n=1 Tax=Flavihumibacter sp. ZG627 TaxID=1463156 RepID=UPI001C1227FB|nr:arabinan endo-1,5-alpha-L-arabinosidase [Flavihumibacter sp. ZG627]